jgi:hypothetical protein
MGVSLEIVDQRALIKELSINCGRCCRRILQTLGPALKVALSNSHYSLNFFESQVPNKTAGHVLAQSSNNQIHQVYAVSRFPITVILKNKPLQIKNVLAFQYIYKAPIILV